MSKKGPDFERSTAKQLSLWWTQDDPEPIDDVFWRTQSSGARATTRAKKGKKTVGQYGDICAVDERGKAFTDVFTVSLKRGYQDINLDSLFHKPGNKNSYRKFIDEAEETRAQAGSVYYMLIIKPDFRDPVVILPYSDCFKFDVHPYMFLSFEANETLYSVSVLKLGSLLEVLKPQTVKNTSAKWRLTRKQ